MAAASSSKDPARGLLDECEPLTHPEALVALDLRAALEFLPDFGTLDAKTLPAFRASLAMPDLELGVKEGLRVSRVSVPGPHGDVDALLYEPSLADEPRPAILNIHGGGYVAGSAERDDAGMRILASKLGCVILSPNYRLAPEHPYPAGSDDCAASLEWLVARRAELGLNGRLALRGISAGGGLALGLALRVRDEGRIALDFLDLLYPMLDDRTNGHPYNGQYVWTASANAFGWAALLGGGDPTCAGSYAVPARVASVKGLPPTFLAIGSIDLFASETLRMAGRMIDSGNSVEMHVYPGAYHGFPLITGAQAAQAYARDELDAYRRAWPTRAEALPQSPFD